MSNHVSERESEAPATHGQNDALRDQLTDHAPSSRAKREAHADLPLPCARADDQESSNVGAGDQQNDTDHAHQNSERVRIFAPKVGESPIAWIEHDARRIVWRGRRVGEDGLTDERFRFGLGAAHDFSGLHARHHQEPPTIPPLSVRRAASRTHRGRSVHKGEHDVGPPARKDAEKRRRQDSDYRDWRAVDGDPPPDNVRRFRKRPPPEMVADHGDGLRARLVVVFCQRSPEDLALTRSPRK